MTETTAELVVEMRLKDLLSKNLAGIQGRFAKLRQAGSDSFGKLSSSVKKFSTASLKSIGSFVDSARKKLLSIGKISLLGGVAASAGFGKSFAQEAIQFEETASKFRVVFKDAAASAVKDLESISTATGVSRVDLTGYFSDLQDTFVPLGFALKDAAKLSSQITELGVDLASFGNKDVGDTIRDLQSALVGNAETVRKYGIVITETSLKQEAYRLGLAKTGQELSEQAKVQARLSIIFRSTADAQGDAARTLDSTANVFKQIKSAYTELKVVFGRELITNIRSVIDELGGVAGITNLLKVGMGALTRGANLLIDALGGIAKIGKSVIDSFGDADSLANLLSGRFGRIGREAKAAAVGVEAFQSAFFGIKGSGFAAAVAERFDFPVDAITRTLKERFGKLFSGIGSFIYEGALYLGLQLKRGLIETFNGFQIDLPFGKTFAIDLNKQLEATNASIESTVANLTQAKDRIKSSYEGLAYELYIPFLEVKRLAGSLKIDPGKDLIDKNFVATIVAQFTDAGRQGGAAFGAGLNASFATAQLGAVFAVNTAVDQLVKSIQAQQAGALAAVKAGQIAINAVVSSPANFAAFFAAGTRQWSGYEQGAIRALSNSQLPGRVDEFFSSQERQIAEAAARQTIKAGGQVANENGEPTKRYLDTVRQLRQEFQASGVAATGAFKAGVRDASQSLSSFADQAAGAGRDLVFGLNSSLSDSFNDFITKAKDAGDAWDAFRDRFKQVLARIVSDLLASRITSLITSIFGLKVTPGTGQGISGSAQAANGGVLHSSVGTPVDYRAFASGGVANGPTLALFGEKQKEAFVPLPNNGKIPVELNGSGGGGGQVSVSFNVSAIDAKGVKEFFASEGSTIANIVAEAISSNKSRNLRTAIQGVR